MAISVHDVASDIKALRSIAKALRALINDLETEEYILRALGKCGVCGADVGLKFRAILTRKHGVKEITLHAADYCCSRRKHEDLEYTRLHPDHQ